MRLLLSLGWMLALGNIVFADERMLEVAHWLKERVTPIQSVNPSTPLADLAPLGDLVGEARVVSLGEATHGSRELFLLKHRILEYLVREKGFTVLALEANYPGMRRLDRALFEGDADLSSMLRSQGSWMCNTQELLGVLTWMQKHNRTQVDEQRKLHVFGLDVQDVHGGLEQALIPLVATSPKVAESIKSWLAPFSTPGFSRADYASLSETERERLRRGARSLDAAYDLMRPVVIGQVGEDAWRWARHAATTVRQNERMWRSMVAASHGRGDLAGRGSRDQAMAENVSWILDHGGQDAKVVLWAHNAHVGMESTPGEVRTMGAVLERTFGDAHVAVGMTFVRGSFRALCLDKDLSRPFEVREPRGDSIERAWELAKLGQGWIDLRGASGSATGETPIRSMAIRHIGASFREELQENAYQRIALSDHFDALIVLETSTPSRPNGR